MKKVAVKCLHICGHFVISVDSNFLRLPLTRDLQVLEDGSFVAPQNAKLTYAGMLAIRAALPIAASRNLAMAVTIATRYSCVRRQSELKPG